MVLKSIPEEEIMKTTQTELIDHIPYFWCGKCKCGYNNPARYEEDKYPICPYCGTQCERKIVDSFHRFMKITPIPIPGVK